MRFLHHSQAEVKQTKAIPDQFWHAIENFLIIWSFTLHSLTLLILKPTTFARVQNLKTWQQLWPLGHQRRTKNAKDRANRKIPEKHILRFGHGSVLASAIRLWWAAIWKRQKLPLKRWKWGRWKALDKFRGCSAIVLAFTATAQLSPGAKLSGDNNDATNVQVYRNTCDRLMNKNTKRYPRVLPGHPKWIKTHYMHFGILLCGYLTYKKPTEPSKVTKSQENFCSSFSEPIIERMKTELWQDLGVLSTLRGKSSTSQIPDMLTHSLFPSPRITNPTHCLFQHRPESKDISGTLTAPLAVNLKVD